MTSAYRMLLADLNASTYPPSGKMERKEVIDPKAKIKEYRAIIVDDPNATPWEIIDSVVVRYVGHGVNADANQIESAAAVHVRESKERGSDRRGRPRVYRSDAESSVQEAAGESQTEEEVTTHASDPGIRDAEGDR